MRRHIVTVLVTLLFGTGIFFHPGTAAPVLDQSFTSPGYLGANINSCCRFVAQTFTAGLNGTLTGINVDITTIGNYPLHIAIRTVANGAPSSTVLGETTLGVVSAPLSLLITFPQTIHVVSGIEYAIVADYEGAPAGEWQGWWNGASGVGGDPYPRGTEYTSYSDGVSWVRRVDDLHFQTYVEVELTPLPSYDPGVTPGDWVKYGQVTGSWTDLPPVPPFSDFRNANTIRTYVSAVSGHEVTAIQTWDLNNGTGTRNQTLIGNVMTGSGNLTFWIIAGGLNAGDKISEDPTFPTINTTLTKTYLGVDRTVNFVNITLTINDLGATGVFKGTWYWDQVTGVLLETSFFESVTSPYFSGTGSGYAVITETNLWAFPDFSVKADPEALTTNPGSDASTVLTLTSQNGFSGTVSLSASAPSGLAIGIVPESISLTPDQSETATMTIAVDESVPEGVYNVDATATSGYLSRTVQVGVTVQQAPAAPSFILSVTPTTLNIQAGTTATSSLTITSESGFAGTVFLLANAPSGIIVSVNPAAITNSGTATVTVTVAGGVAAGTYTITLEATYGSTTRTASLAITVTSPLPERTPTLFGLDPTLFYASVAAAVVALIAGLLLARKRLFPAQAPARVTAAMTN